MIYLIIALILLHIIQFFKAYYSPKPFPKKGFCNILKEPAIIAHRGSAGEFPENTILSFTEGLKKAQGLELDVGISRNGSIMVIHDLTVERTTDGFGLVRDKDLQELLQLDAGYWFKRDSSFPFRGKNLSIPTLERVLQTFQKTPLLIEVKGSGKDLAQKLAKTISQYKARDRVLIAGKDDETIKYIRNYLPDVPTGVALKEGILFFLLAHIGLATWFSWNFQALCIPPKYKSFPLLTYPVRLAAKGLGLPIYLWTINHKGEMERYIDGGIQGLISDYPGLVREVLEKRSKVKEKKKGQ